jgi:hypothetical protein
MSLTVTQKINDVGFPKPGELIEITGAHGLEASDRAILNKLYELAHAAGNIGDFSAEWSVPLSQIRHSSHESNDRLRESLVRLMKVVVSVPYIGEDGGPEILLTHLFDFFTLPKNDASTVRFGLPRKLAPILARSNRWGRIKAEVVCAMSSRYAITLYELLQLRANMDRCIEVFPVERFRALLGVPPGTYLRGPDFVRFVLETAALEINGLSDMGVTIEVRRRSPRAPIEGVCLAWWRKEDDAFRETLRERERSKLGRTARLRGTVETVSLSQVRSR